MVSREIMRSSTRNFKKYYNPKVGNEIRMDTNTNMLGSNPAANKYLSEQTEGIDGYPNTYSDSLRESLGELYNLEKDNFVAGSGSDEILDIIFKTFTEFGDKCIVPDPSYTLYDYFVKMNGGSTRLTKLTEDFQLNVEDILSSPAKIIIIPSPNNPTGNCFKTKDLEEILSKFRGIVVIDEAYGEYAKESMISKVNEFENLIIIRTFSKAYAMAGLRVGYSASCIDIADMMNSVKIPYSLNKISEGAAIAAVKDQEFIKRSKALIDEERPKLMSELKKLGFEPYPSDSNFILARCPIDHSEVTNKLKDKGILIRDFGNKPETENCVRMTVGTSELNSMLISKLSEILKESR